MPILENIQFQRIVVIEAYNMFIVSGSYHKPFSPFLAISSTLISMRVNVNDVKADAST